MRSSEHFRFPGKATSTSPSSCWAWCVIPCISTSGFTIFLIRGAWLLVDSSVRRISSLFSLPTSISVLALTVCAFQNRVSTLRPSVQVHWPDWWTPVGVANHEKSFCLYFHCILSLGCAVRVKLLFPLQGGRSTLGKQLTGVCLVRVSVFSRFPLLSLWVSGVVVFTVVPWSPEKSPEESFGPLLVGAFTGLEVTGSLFLLCLSRVLMRRGLFHPRLDEGLV